MEQEPESANPSHELDMVTLFSSANHDAEMVAVEIQSIMEANDIPAVVVGASVIPSLDFQVRVPRADLERAQRILAEAEEAGPAAAAEAEAASEQTQ